MLGKHYESLLNNLCNNLSTPVSNIPINLQTHHLFFISFILHKDWIYNKT